jgi:hypothetical protein
VRRDFLPIKAINTWHLLPSTSADTLPSIATTWNPDRMLSYVFSVHLSVHVTHVMVNGGDCLIDGIELVRQQ